MAQTVIGIFDNQAQAQQAVEALYETGISRERIDISQAKNVENSSLGETRDEDDSFGESVGRFFRSLFSDEEDVEKYSSVAKTGTIVAVHSEDSEEAMRASEILDSAGAVDVDERFMSNYEEDDNELRMSDHRDTSVDSMSDNTTGDTTSIPVVEEHLNVGKREVEEGAVRIRSRIIEKPVEESLRLREQTVMIERTPVNRAATGADADLQEGEIEIRKTREVPVVNKEARVVEEVKIRKDVREREEVIRDTVRRKDVDVDEVKKDVTKERAKRKKTET